MQLLTGNNISFVNSTFLPSRVWGRKYILSILDHLPASTKSKESTTLPKTPDNKEHTGDNKLRAGVPYDKGTQLLSGACEELGEKSAEGAAGQIRASCPQLSREKSVGSI